MQLEVTDAEAVLDFFSEQFCPFCRASSDATTADLAEHWPMRHIEDIARRIGDRELDAYTLSFKVYRCLICGYENHEAYER